jgi:hypothetical protein
MTLDNSETPQVTEPASRARLLLPALLCLLFVGQCIWFIGTQSLTNDEPEHISAGLEAWRYGEFKAWDAHPPLGRLWFAAPLLFTDWAYSEYRGGVQPARPGPEEWAWRTRPMNVLLGLFLAVLLWSTARRLFSEGAANFALALFAFSPSLIAHFSLSTTDGAGTLLIFASAVQLLRWRRNPSRTQTVLLGAVLGGSLVAKFYAAPLVAMAVVMVLLFSPGKIAWRPREWNWAKACGVTGVVLLTVWAAYFFHVSRVTFRDGVVTATFPGRTPSLTEKVPVQANLTFFLPACEFFTGLGNQVHHNWIRGHNNYFLGEVSHFRGWKLYFPMAIVLKWPTMVLLLALAALSLTLRGKIRWPRELLMMSLFPALFLFFAIGSNINIGDRYVLPVYIFVLLGLAAVWTAARSRAAKIALLAALVLNAADGLRYAPDYLSHFNIFVRPAESWRLLSDSSLDWGQGLLALRDYQAAHPGETIHLAYFGPLDPALYGIRYVPIAENERVTGTVVVSATHLSGQLLRDPRAYHWLLQYPRKTILDHSLHVFEVPAAPN